MNNKKPIPRQGDPRHRWVHWISDSEGQKQRRIPVALRIVIGLFVLILIGTLLLMLPGMTVGPRLTVTEALFTATSALTVTGLTVVTTSSTFTFTGHVVLLCLIQLGGVGYMFAAAVVMRFLGRRLSLLDRLALSRSLGLNTPRSIQQILKRSLVGIVFIESIGALLLYWHWAGSGLVPAERAWFYAIFHAVSAFCNAGFDLFFGLPLYPDGIPNDSTSLLIMGVLIVTGGLGIPVLSELFTWQWRHHFSLHTRITLAVAAALIVVGWVGLFIPETRPGGVLHSEPLSGQLVRTLFQSISTRTAGFPGLADFDSLQQESELIIMGLMFIGSAPASMGGGITTGTFAVLVLALWGYARGLPATQAGKRTISLGTVRRAGAILTISIGLVFTASWLILLTHDFAMDRVLFEVISAFATCGLSLGITGDLNTFGRLIIVLMMFWGRLGALTIVIALAQRGAQHKQLVQYPEEPVLIG